MTQPTKPKWVEEYVPTDLAESKIFRYSVKIDNQVIEIDLFSELDVDYDLIEEQLTETPAQYSFAAALYSELRLQATIMERKIKAKRGRLTKHIYDGSAAANVKLPEYIVKNLVETDQTLNTMEAELAILQRNAGKLYHKLEALNMKAENLRSLSGFKKRER